MSKADGAQTPHRTGAPTAAHIADALMQLALEFDNTHYAQIRRHYQSIAPEPDNDPRQLDLFTP